MKSKVLLEPLLIVFLSVLLFAAGTGIVFLMLLTVITVPALFMVLERRRGTRVALICVYLGTFLILLFAGPVLAMFYMFSMALLGVIFGYLAGRAKTGTDFMLTGITASVAVKVSLLLLFFITTGENIFVISPEAAEQIIANAILILPDFNAAMFREVMATMVLRMPAIWIAFSALDTFISYVVCHRVIKKFGGNKIVSIPPFGLWKFPKNIFIAFVAAVLADAASKALPNGRVLEMVSVNVLELTRWMFFIEGLSLCWYYMTARAVNRPFKIAVTGFCVVYWPISFVLASIGFFDIWFDLRRHIRRK